MLLVVLVPLLVVPANLGALEGATAQVVLETQVQQAVVPLRADIAG